MKSGVTRLVFKIGNYVIKIPNFTYSHINFLNGCYANYSERSWYKTSRYNLPEENIKLAPSIFCLYFGLFQIQKYCKPLQRNLTDFELKYFESVRGGETKKENFGYYKNYIVCVDYP